MKGLRQSSSFSDMSMSLEVLSFELLEVVLGYLGLEV
jgi:hypothetical protein